MLGYSVINVALRPFFMCQLDRTFVFFFATLNVNIQCYNLDYVNNIEITYSIRRTRISKENASSRLEYD